MAKKDMAVSLEKKLEDTETVKSTEQQPMEKLPADPKSSPKKYRIICRNRIMKQIGGVDFMNGEGYTFDAYAASWFAAKDGYTVEPAE